MRTAFVSFKSLCPGNQYLGECFKAFFRGNGLRLVPSREQAQVVVVSGCNTDTANPDFAREYAAFSQANPEKLVVLAGCPPPPGMTRSLKGAEFHILRYRDILEAPAKVERLFGLGKPFVLLPSSLTRQSAAPKLWGMVGVDLSDVLYIRAGDGCRGACTFCAVRSAKGKVRSVALEDVARDLEQGYRDGWRRFWLYADDLGAWGTDIGTDLSDLLGYACRSYPSARFLLDQTHPGSLLPIFRKLEPFLPQVQHWTLPAQSGSDRILGLMGRRHKTEPVLEMIARIKKSNPDIVLATHIICGFPTETRPEFADSLRLAPHFDVAGFFAVQPLEGTQAAAMKGRLAQDEVSRRVDAAGKLGGKIGYDLYRTSGTVMWLRRDKLRGLSAPAARSAR